LRVMQHFRKKHPSLTGMKKRKRKGQEIVRNCTLLQTVGKSEGTIKLSGG